MSDKPQHPEPTTTQEQAGSPDPLTPEERQAEGDEYGPLPQRTKALAMVRLASLRRESPDDELTAALAEYMRHLEQQLARYAPTHMADVWRENERLKLDLADARAQRDAGNRTIKELRTDLCVSKNKMARSQTGRQLQAETAEAMGRWAAELDRENTRLRQRAEQAEAENERLRDALREIHNWLVCAPIASNDDMAQNFAYMESVADQALTTPADGQEGEPS